MTEVTEAVAASAWVLAAVDAERSLNDLRAATAAAASRDESALRVFSAAARTLAETRAALANVPGIAAEAAVLAQLDARVAGILADTTAAAEARRKRAEQLGKAAAAAADAARDAACGKLSRASEAVRVFAAEHVALCDALSAAEARLAEPVPSGSPSSAVLPADATAVAASATDDISKLCAALAAETARADALQQSLDAAAAEVAALRARAAQSAPPAEDASRKPARARATREPGAAHGAPASAADAAADAALRAAAAFKWSSAAERCAANDAAWNAFIASPPARIRAEHVPWPDTDAVREAAGPLAGAAPSGAAVVDVRALRARWHPDRFAQKFSTRIAPEERDEVLRRVNDVACALNAITLP